MSHIIRDSSVVVQTPSFSTRAQHRHPADSSVSGRCCQHTSPRHSAEHREEGCPRWRVCPSSRRARRLSPAASIAELDTPRPCRLTNATVTSRLRSSRRLARLGPRGAPGTRASRRRRWRPRSAVWTTRCVHPSAHISPCPRRHPYSPTPPRPVQADRGASRADIQLTHRLAPRSRPLPSSPLSLRRFPSPCPDPRRNSPWAR